jgi:enterochelin esterase family protein
VVTVWVTLLMASMAFGQVKKYELGPDSMRQPGVPQGKVTQLKWNHSKVFPDTERDWWVYVPAQYDPKKSAALMVVQDGAGAVNEKGPIRIPIVFDNLIHKGEMPVTIGVFINPGRVKGQDAKAKPRNRSFEYDTLSDQYVRFLLEEILPEVQKKYNITDDREGWAIHGVSSGGICAFTAAWERPDKFSKVVSHVGSFTNIRGGHNYAAMIRKTPPKPIRVFLEDGAHDLDNQHGNWWLANLQMEKSLTYAGYDLKTVWGEGGHSNNHGGAIFPDTMRWLWRDYKGE